jgi:hypothetical protein
VFTARYALSPYIKQIRFVFKGLNVVEMLRTACGVTVGIPTVRISNTYPALVCQNPCFEKTGKLE